MRTRPRRSWLFALVATLLFVVPLLAVQRAAAQEVTLVVLTHWGTAEQKDPLEAIFAE